MQESRGFYTPALLAFVGLVLRLGLVHSYPAAVAAWLTCWSHVVVEFGLTSTEEPTSSNSKSSASEPYWIRSSWFWALPVLATPWMPAHWLELSPSLVAEKSWLTSPLSVSCSASWPIWAMAGTAATASIASMVASTINLPNI